jgi:hypothetical protein
LLTSCHRRRTPPAFLVTFRHCRKSKTNRDKLYDRSFAAEDEATSSDDSCGDVHDGDYRGGARKDNHPEAGITYSFDAARSADANGCEFLGGAVEKAVERWETGVTEKLLKDEYEVVPPEHLDGPSKGRRASRAVDLLLEDDFEIV